MMSVDRSGWHEALFAAFVGIDWEIKSMCGARKPPTRRSVKAESRSMPRKRWRSGLPGSANDLLRSDRGGARTIARYPGAYAEQV